MQHTLSKKKKKTDLEFRAVSRERSKGLIVFKICRAMLFFITALK